MNDTNLEAGPSYPGRLGIAIVNYFSQQSVSVLLESLSTFASEVPTVVVIVDNSQDPGRRECESLQSLSRVFASDIFQVEVVRASMNLGYGAGNNLAIDRLIELKSSLLWVLNPDTHVTGSAKQLLSEAFSSECSIWSTITIQHGIRTNGLGTLNTLTGQAGSTGRTDLRMRRFSFEYPGGHSIVFSTDSWGKLGGFDEDFFLVMEEADLAIRSLSIGLTIGTLTSASVRHEQGLTTGSSSDISSKSVVAFREATKSRVIFFRKYYPRRLPVLIASRFAYMIFVLSRGNRLGARAVFDGICGGLRKRITTGVHDHN